MGRFRLEMNERLVIGSRCRLNLTPTFASGDSVVVRVLRGTKVSYGRSPECSPAIAAAAAAIVPLDLVKEIGAGASGLRRKSLGRRTILFRRGLPAKLGRTSLSGWSAYGRD